MEAQLKLLINERRSIKTLLTRFKKFFKKSRELVMLTEIKKQYETCGSLYDKYINIQKSIEEIVERTEESSHCSSFCRV